MRYQALGAIFVVLIGCNRPPKPPTPYGPAFNAKRQALGLPPIPANWPLSQDLGTQLNWVNPLHAAGTTQPVHAYKQLNLTPAGAPDYEFDYYCSGKEFHDSTGDHGYEGVQILFRFAKHAAGQNPWEVSASLPNYRSISTMDEAEGLLQSWGLKRIAATAPATRGGAVK